jgi:chromate transporter
MFEIMVELFLIFFKIGIFTFGGGYAMIPLFRQELVGGGYISEALLLDFIGISESTPGPFAVNMATFIGTEYAGILGAFAATLGVVLPSFLIILLIARFGSKFLASKTVTQAFIGLKPVVIGLIFSVAIMLIFKQVTPAINFKEFVFNFEGFDVKAIFIMAVSIFLIRYFKKVSPILIIVLSAVLGIILYGII